MNRLATRKADASSAMPTSCGVGIGICMPSATKNSVTKKSRMLTTLATTSRLYGNVEMAMPAISAPISRESPAALAAAQTMKHHASDPIRTSSGSFATERNSRGSSVLLMTSVTATSSTPLPSEPSSLPNCGFSRFGWMPSTTIAQMSWKISTPSVMRPGNVSSSNLSYRSFTTIIVLLIARHTAR